MSILGIDGLIARRALSLLCIFSFGLFYAGSAISAESPRKGSGGLLMHCRSLIQPTKRPILFKLDITGVEVENEQSVVGKIVDFTVIIKGNKQKNTRLRSSSGAGVNMIKLFGDQFLFRTPPIDLQKTPVSLTFESGPLTRFPAFSGNCEEVVFKKVSSK